MTEGFLLDRGTKEQRSLSPVEVQQVIDSLLQHQVGFDGIGLLIIYLFESNFNQLQYMELWISGWPRNLRVSGSSPAL